MNDIIMTIHGIHHYSGKEIALGQEILGHDYRDIAQAANNVMIIIRASYRDNASAHLTIGSTIVKIQDWSMLMIKLHDSITGKQIDTSQFIDQYST